MLTDLLAAVRPSPVEGKANEPWLRQQLAAQLVAEQPAAILAHLVLLLAIGALLFPVAPAMWLGAWLGILVLAIAARVAAWRLALRHPSPESQLAGVRASVTVVGLAWGMGAAVLIPHITADYVGLVLLVIAGLVAAAVGTLNADPPAFRLFVLGILGPLPLAVLLHGRGRVETSTVFLIIFFAGFMWVQHSRSHDGLLAHLRSAARLRRSDAESRQQRALVEALFASVPNPIVVMNAEGLVLTVNPAFELLFGFSSQESLRRPLVDLVVPPQGRAAALELQDRVRRGETVGVELERQCKDGRLVTVQIAGARVELEGEVMVLLLYTEVTAIRRAEAALRAAQARLEQVLASSTAVIYVTRVEGATFMPIWVSENLTRITGYDMREALDPAWWVNRLHPEDRPRVFADLRRLLSEDHVVSEYRFRPKNGDGYRWMHDESRLTRDASGKPLEIFGAWLDITERKTAEDAMREARDLAERAARTRAAFLANMSHEIRTPMNAVLGVTELVLDTELSAYQRRSLSLVRSAGETLLTLLNDILDFSKIEAEHVALESVSFDLRYLLESTTSLLASRIGDRPIELVADVAADVPHLVQGDPTRLRQVLTNLVGNAIKFTSEGEVVVSATKMATPDGSALLRFAVRDTGIGIPAGELDKIFDEFMQADASMTRRYGGTGLGLAISKRLVALMGGTLTVSSTVGEGSEFAFTLSLPVEAERPAALPGTGRLAGQRMLVVDDNATNRRIVREMLTMAEVAVDEAATVEQGLTAIRQAQQESRPYAVAIIDVQMPDRDGFELATAVRGDPTLAGTRLLMLTSAGQRGDSERCREVGIEGYVTKPVSRTELLEITATMLGSPGQPGGAALVTRHTVAEARRRLHILLAEDNAVNQMLAAAMLRKRGHRVDIVGNGLEAVSEVGRQAYDVVLMDIQMPEMDGFAATRAIRATPAGADLPIIALTAHALTGERERCLANGMSGYLTKPFRPHDLFAAVEELGKGEAAGPEEREREPEFGAVDLDHFRRTMREAGAEDAVDGILEMFVEHAPGRLAAVASAVEAGEAPAIARAVHAFKSPAAAIGATRLAGLLQDIELAAREGAVDRVRARFERLAAETGAVLEHLKQQRENGENHG